MKMQFPYAGNTKEGKYNEGNQLIDILRKYKNRGDSNFIANYLISIIEQIISFNYTSFTYVFNIYYCLIPFILNFRQTIRGV